MKFKSLKKTLISAIAMMFSFGPTFKMLKQFLLILFCAISLTAYSQENRFSGKLQFKEIEIFNGEAYYKGQLSVPEDRNSMVGKSIDLNIIVLPATSNTTLDPVVVMMGPISLTENAMFYANNLPEIRKDRDIVLIDQRGSWNSNPLNCTLPRYTNSIYNFQDQKTFAKNIGNTLREVESKGTAQNYTNSQVVDDIDAIRKWLGYEQINIWASGVGTITARTYLFKYSENVRTLVLHSVQPIDHSAWTQSQRLARERLKEIFETCHADSACRAAYPELSEHFGLLYNRITSLVEYTDLELEDGSMTKIGIDQIVLENIIYRSMMSATESSLIPWIIEKAYNGDIQVLAQRAAIHKRKVPLGTYLCLACNEDPIHKDPRAITYDENTPFSSFFLRKEVEFCRAWPKTEADINYMKPFKSHVPTLILSGSIDHTSPPGYGSEAASNFKNSKHYVLEGRAKNDVDAVMIDLITEMIQEGSSKNLNRDLLKEMLVMPFYLP